MRVLIGGEYGPSVADAMGEPSGVKGIAEQCPFVQEAAWPGDDTPSGWALPASPPGIRGGRRNLVHATPTEESSRPGPAAGSAHQSQTARIHDHSRDNHSAGRGSQYGHVQCAERGAPQPPAA